MPIDVKHRHAKFVGGERQQGEGVDETAHGVIVDDDERSQIPTH